jgi:hypothetical protein
MIIELRQKCYLSKDIISKILIYLKKYKITYSNYNHELLIIRVYVDNINELKEIKNILIDGTLGILKKKGNDFVISPNTNAYKEILKNHPKATTNSILLYYNTFGIAATVKLLQTEFEKVLCKENSLDKRHIALLCNVMCYYGKPKSIKTEDNKDPSPFSKAGYQRSLNTFLKAGLNKEIDENVSVTSKIALGYRLDSNLLDVVCL